MSNILGKDIVGAIRDLDPATDQVARGIDHYVVNFGDKMDKLFGIGPKPVPAKVNPVAEAPAPVMPTPDDEMMQLSKRRSLTEMMRRRGRASTILTDPLGGG